MNSTVNKFVFNIDFQWAILQYTLTDKNGFKIVDLYKPEYFDNIHQRVIADGIKTFYKARKRIPDSVTLGEEVRKLFLKPKYADLFLKTDRIQVTKRITKLFKGHVKEPDSILDDCIKFASYVKFRNTLSTVNIEDFSQYGNYCKQFQEAINVGVSLKENQGTFLVNGVKLRQIQRQNNENIYPTPFRQMNRSTNGGGYTKGSLIVIIDKGKGGKTKVLINIAKGYLKMRKKVLYIDLENGEANITDRMDQSILGKDKMEILSGKHDLALQKIYRRYKRLGSDILIRRLPSLTTTTDDLQKVVDWAYNEHGFKTEILVLDYAANMGCLSNIKNDDNARISNAYIDLKNFADKNDLESVWTGHHTVRLADKRRPTKYEPNDTAKCIDVHRHVDAMWGINQNDSERANDVFRLELVDQRDGVQEFKVLMKDYPKIQRIQEFNKEELQAYYEQETEIVDKVKKAPLRKPINDL